MVVGDWPNVASPRRRRHLQCGAPTRRSSPEWSATAAPLEPEYLRKLLAMASFGRKSAYWTTREAEKLLDILIEQRAQGAVKFEWSSLRAMLKSEGVDKDAMQMKNHFYDSRKKLKAWEYLIGKASVGVDCTTGVVVVPNDVWEDFLQEFGGKYKSFRTRAPPNLEKLKSACYGKYATGEMSFTPDMVASGSNLNKKLKGLAVGAEEHMGDSDEGNDGGSAGELQCISAMESHSPPKSVHNSRKRKSGGGNSGNGKRHELNDWASRDDEIDRALDILRTREEARQGPSLYKQVQARLKRHPVISAMGLAFILSVMYYIMKEKEEKYFVDLDDEFVLMYIQSRGFNIGVTRNSAVC